MSLPDIKNIKSFFQTLQNSLCTQLAQTDSDNMSFKEDIWQRVDGGGGCSRVLTNGALFEQAGVNFSHVYGNALPPSASAHRPELAGCSYQAMGVSVVLHPLNPYIPTAHANVRFFIAQKANELPIWWFGGGFDLTPYYGFQEDAIHWHRTAKQICAPFGEEYYPRYKKWCDEYFFIKHRNEARGIGGIFFDDLNTPDFATSFTFTRAVGEGFLSAYLPIVEKRRQLSWGERERQFQLYRRGRYAEFNLVCDRGTLFGLQSAGRTESILMSMPPLARWQYNYQPPEESAEALLYNDFLPVRDWLAQE